MSNPEESHATPAIQVTNTSPQEQNEQHPNPTVVDQSNQGDNNINNANKQDSQPAANDQNKLKPPAPQSLKDSRGRAGTKTPKDKGKKGFLKKKELAGIAVRGEHLHRLTTTTKLNRQQILIIASKFLTLAPSGYMDLPEFKKALEFDKDDKFAERLFTYFEVEKGCGYLSMDDFIVGVAKVAPEADINTKLDLCYDLFDLDGSGGVQMSEFREMTKYSMRHGKFGIGEEKLNTLVDLQWKQLDYSGDNEVSRDEFKTVLRAQKAFVNSLTLQVPWLQAAFRAKQVSNVANKDYLGNEPLDNVVRDVANQMNASEEDVVKWIGALKRNLYFDVKSLKEMSSEDWNSMEVPRRLFNAIKKVIEPERQSSSEILEGRLKQNVAISTKLIDRARIYIEANKSAIFFFTLYVLGNFAMLAWTLTKYLTNRVGDKYHEQFNIIGASFVVSRCAGALVKYNFSLMLFPVCYRTMTWLRSSTLETFLPIDSAMIFHRRVGAFILLMGLTHMVAHCVNFLRLSQATDIDRVNAAFGFHFSAAPTQAALHSTRTGVTGWIMVGLMLALVLCAHERVRRGFFKLFFAVHHLYLPIIVCLVIHDGLINPIEIIYWMIPSILLFVIERALTVWRGAPKYESLEGTRILKGDVLALCIRKPAWFKYSAGHYLWINCPELSLHEWHPFTLTSSPDEDFLMVNINCIGDWTKDLRALYEKYLSKPENNKGKSRSKDGADTKILIELESPKAKSTDIEADNLGESANTLLADGQHATEAEMMVPTKGVILPALRVDGPYGTASGDVLLYTHVVLIGGGIGVTPFISILKSIRHAVLYSNNCPLHAVHFIWVTKGQENFQWFSMMLADLQRHEDLRGFLRVSIYLTGPRHPINDIRLLGVSLLMNTAKKEFNEDLVTGLEGQTHFGRPDFGKILLQHNKEWAGNDVGVFFCGPEPLAQAIRVTCRALNKSNQASSTSQKKKGAQFVFQQEHF